MPKTKKTRRILPVLAVVAAGALVLGVGVAVTSFGPADAQTVANAPVAASAPPAATAPANRAARAPVPAPPTLAARSYALFDAQSNQLLAGFNEDLRVEPASLTKLMTAYVVFHALRDGKLRLDQPVPVSEYAWRTGGAKSGGSTTFLDLNSRVKVEDLLQGMIVQSGNDASIALAEAVAGSEATFAQLMNEYSRRLGMNASNWTNSPGLPHPDHYTTARDLGLLGAAIVREFPEYYRWYSQRSFTFNGITQRNRNGLLDRDPTVDGMKTGHTASAGYCLASSAQREGMRLVSIVMGTNGFRAREEASAALLGYGFNFFESRRLYTAGQQVGTTQVFKSGEPVPVVVRGDVYATAPRGELDGARAELVLNPRLVAPLAADQSIGRLRVTLGDRVVADLPAYPQAAVPEGGIFRRLVDAVRLWMA